MRKSFVAAVAIAAALTIATPASAAPRERDRNPSVIKMVKMYVAKMFGIKLTADPTVPIPLKTTADPTVPIPEPEKP